MTSDPLSLIGYHVAMVNGWYREEETARDQRWQPTALVHDRRWTLLHEYVVRALSMTPSKGIQDQGWRRTGVAQGSGI